ncbi:TPA: DNA primase, partial [Escherichia coli]
MKNAPSLKYQPKDKFTEVIIFAGTDAYAHAQHWIESEGRKHGDNVPPVYLGPKQLADLANIRIIDEKRRFARVYIAGEIEPIQINTIAEKLALAGVQEAKLYKGITDQEPENWRDYLQRIREQAEHGEVSVMKLATKNSGLPKPA